MDPKERDRPKLSKEAIKRRRSRRLKQRLESLLGGGIGLLALFVSAYTVYIQRQQLKVQAWPRLTLETDSQKASGPNDVGFVLSLKNRGFAPAEVRGLRVTVAGEEASDWIDVFTRFAREEGAGHAHLQWDEVGSPVGGVIGVGQDVTLFSSTSAETALLMAEDESVHISVCYCSVLDDCWILEAPPHGPDTTTPVAMCPKYKPFAALPEPLAKASIRARMDAGSRATAPGDAGR